MGGAMLTFEHPNVLEYAAIAFFLFSTHQFYLAVGNPFARFLNQTRQRLAKEKKLRAHINERAQAKLERARNEEWLWSLLGFTEDEQPERDPVKGQWNHGSRAHWGRGPDKTGFGVHVWASAQDERSSRVSQYTVRVSSFLYFGAILKTWVEHIAKQDTFWGDVFPSIMAFIAAGTVLLNQSTWL